MNALTAKEAEAWTSEMARVANMTIREILEAADRNNIDRDSAVPDAHWRYFWFLILIRSGFWSDHSIRIPHSLSSSALVHPPALQQSDFL